MTQTIEFTEPTEAQLREKIYTLQTICMRDVWLAAFLGSTVAQRVVGCPDIHRATLEMLPRQIGSFLEIYDDEHGNVVKRVALILAKALLPKWKIRFPGDPLGDHVMVSIVSAIRTGINSQVTNGICDRICYGKYGSTTEISGALGKMLRVANGQEELYLSDTWPLLETDVQLFVAMLGRGLVPYLLARQDTLFDD